MSGTGGTTYWTENSMCIDTPKTVFEYYLPQCSNYTTISSIEDMYNPIRIFYQNIIGGFCVAFNNSQNINQVGQQTYAISNSSDFTSLIQQYKHVADVDEYSYLYNPSSFVVNIPQVYDLSISIANNLGKYMPLSPLIIQESTNVLYSLKLPVTSPYGSCKNNLDNIRFLQNKKLTCSYKLVYDTDSCNSFNSKNIFYDNSPLLAYNSTSNKTEYIQPTITAYYIVNKMYYKEISLNNNINSNFQAGSSLCTCFGVVTGINYEFLMNDVDITNYTISYYFEDFSDSCGNTDYIPVTYTINFRSDNVTSDYSRSGNPGYIKGKPLVTGIYNQLIVYNNSTKVNDTTAYVDQFTTPRLIFGIGQEKADRGLCYNNINLTNINGYSINPTNSTNDPIMNSDDFSLLYFNLSQLNQLPVSNGIYENPNLDNEITYADHLSWGCNDELNYVGLKYYCLNQIWKQKTFFNIINDLSSIGQFGNPNRHLILDWVNVETFSLDSFQSIWDSSNNKCTVPSVFNVDILYGTFGLVNNTQQAIYQVRFRIDSTYWWAKNPNDLSMKDNFQTHLNINYYRIPQNTVWWYASVPGFFKLSRNILYPFKFGTTQYGTASSSGSFSTKSIQNNILVYLILIIIILI